MNDKPNDRVVNALLNRDVNGKDCLKEVQGT